MKETGSDMNKKERKERGQGTVVNERMTSLEFAEHPNGYI